MKVSYVYIEVLKTQQLTLQIEFEEVMLEF